MRCMFYGRVHVWYVGMCAYVNVYVIGMAVCRYVCLCECMCL